MKNTTETVKRNTAAAADAANNCTELVFIVDRSGSMQGLEKDTVGGFNGMLKSQKETDAPCFVSTVLFDHETEVLHDRIPLQKVAPITEKEYYVRGCTALLDALGGAIRHIENIHKYARPEDVPAHTMFVVITDGMENASKRFTAPQVKSLIGEKKKAGWEFIFLGANIDAVETAETIGIEAQRAVNYHAVRNLRCSMPMTNEWREEADADFAARSENGGDPGTPHRKRFFGKK